MQRDMRIYMKNNDIINIEDIYTYTIYNKINSLVVITQKDITKEYNLKEITQIEIMTRMENENWATNTDFILF